MERRLQVSQYLLTCVVKSEIRLSVRLKKIVDFRCVLILTMPTERPPLVGAVVPTFADRGCRVVSATDSHGR
jgi:hypothetical protein